MTQPAFDEVIHPENRLRLCAILSSVEALAFAEVREALAVSDSVLSKQAKILQEAGYLTIRKESGNRHVRVWLELTPRGREALAGHLAALRSIAQLASSPT
ncbi:MULTISPECIES: transcriptional regulator [unclassified Modestobacter]